MGRLILPEPPPARQPQQARAQQHQAGRYENDALSDHKAVGESRAVQKISGNVPQVVDVAGEGPLGSQDIDVSETTAADQKAPADAAAVIRAHDGPGVVEAVGVSIISPQHIYGLIDAVMREAADEAAGVTVRKITHHLPQVVAAQGPGMVRAQDVHGGIAARG